LIPPPERGMIKTQPLQPNIESDHSSSQLTLDQIAMINESLSSVGEYGEVRLVIEKGQIRFIEVVQSHDALKWRPGKINPDL
jgi:hypothetical protein